MEKGSSARRRISSWSGVFPVLLIGSAVQAHDPVFGLGPHTLFQGGYEVHLGASRAQTEQTSANAYLLQLKYGITSDWTVGVATPYLDLSGAGISATGRGDAALTTKYRFWRNDQLGVQETAAVSLTTVLDTASNNTLGGAATDVIGGLTYGYEGRKWYRWAAVRYRRNGDGEAGLERGDQLLFDLVGGIRFKPTGYLEPDWVWMVELNGEYSERAQRNGVTLAASGGSEWFVSPGLMWTYRNVAIKSGVQIPLVNDLNGTQPDTDYRATVEFELHY